MRPGFLFVVIQVFLFFPQWGRTFPELTRYQYNNCIACHVSPSGGGVLTPYGRKLSQEVLSTWGTEKETGLLQGLLDSETQEKLDKYFLAGGDLRSVQFHHEDQNVKEGRFIKMQSDLSLGFVNETWAVIAKIGAWLKQDVWVGNATTFYGMWKPKEELSVRIGRMVPQYGLFMMDHFAFVRNYLGFGLSSERDSLEIQWTGEESTYQITQSKQFGLDDLESATTFQYQKYFWDRNKIAVNYWKGSSNLFQRELYGIWGVISFTPHLFWNLELDIQSKTQSLVTTKSFLAYNKWGFTVKKGFDLLALYEYQQTDLNDGATLSARLGPGFQFYPRPHLELSGAWTKMKGADYAWLLFHYYF